MSIIIIIIFTSSSSSSCIIMSIIIIIIMYHHHHTGYHQPSARRDSARVGPASANPPVLREGYAYATATAYADDRCTLFRYPFIVIHRLIYIFIDPILSPHNHNSSGISHPLVWNEHPRVAGSEHPFTSRLHHNMVLSHYLQLHPTVH
jgi:hypothetical protein